MKKSLLLAAAMFMGSAMASHADVLQFGYCSDVVEDNMGGVPAGQYIAAAIEIPAETAEHWKGNKLTGIKIGFGDSKSREVTLFLTDELENAPYYKQSVVAEQKNAWNEYTLDEPYVFNGEKVYVGYMLRVMSALDYPIGIDEDVESASPLGDWQTTGSGQAGMRENWAHYGEKFGNVSIRLTIEGENLPANDGSLLNMSLPLVLKPGEPFAITGRIINRGTAAINSFDVAVKIGDQSEQVKSVTLDEPLPSGTSTNFRIEGLVCDAEAMDVDVKINMPTINGAANSSASTVVTKVVNCSEYAWNRVIVCEEGTGLWCGNCPRGIVGLRMMKEMYPDTFIGIAMHDSNDAPYGMFVQEYLPIIGMLTAFPMSSVDRITAADPSFTTLQGVYKEHQMPVFANVEVSAYFTDDTKTKIMATATTTYGREMDGIDHRIAFVLTEDGIGPYPQTNNYANGALGEMGGFELLDQPAMINLDHVARYVSNPFGDEDSSVTTVSKGDVKTYSREIEIPATVRNVDNVNIVAMIVDNSTALREIYTAGELHAGHIAGVSNVSVDNENAPVEYFNLQGVRVDAPQAGQIVIRRQGTEVSKVLVK